VRIRVIVSLAAIVGLVLCVGSASARTLPQSLARVNVPATERAADLKTLADARALATRVGGSRAQALNAIIKSATQIGNQAAFSPQLARIVFLELQTNVTYLASHALPPSSTRLRIDGVTYESYSGQGLRIQPLGTYFSILEPGQGIASEGGVGVAMTNAQKIVLTDGDSYTLPYLFSWMGHAPNWQSAMAEGVAASAGINAWKRTGDDTFLDSAIRFGNGALDDAITVENNGLWFPLYVFAPSYRVLNGHLQALLSMNDLADATGDEGFADAFNRGVATTKAVLSKYDTGGWGRYAIGEDAPVKYMTLMATQLKDLGKITGDPAFTDMGNKFTADLRTPPIITGPVKPPKPLKLKKFKRQKPFIKLRIVRDKPVTLTLRVFTKKGKSAGVGPFVISVASGASLIKLTLPAKAGHYSIRADAKDWAGNRVKNVVLTTLHLQK
jgi:D-glucuronyl C5-epimerase C-terminus